MDRTLQQVVEHGKPDLGEVLDDQVTADPQHGDRPDDPDDVENMRHDAHDRTPDVVHRAGTIIRRIQGPARQLDTEIIGLHQQSNQAVDEERHEEGHPDQHRDAPHARLSRQPRHRHQHDLRAEDQVRARRRGHDLLFRILRSRGLLILVAPLVGRQPPELLQDLLPALEAQVRAARDQEDGQDLGSEPGQGQRDGQNDDELVDEGTARDLRDDRQLASRTEPRHVLRGDGRVVDDDADCLRGSLHRARGDIVDG